MVHLHSFPVMIPGIFVLNLLGRNTLHYADLGLNEVCDLM